MNKWKRKFCIYISIVFGFLFSIFILNYIVDPFNFNNNFNFGLQKDKISLIMNYRLYKLLNYKNYPKEIIILGDSRGYSLEEAYFKNCGISVANMAYGGGSLYEAIDTFGEIIELTNIKAAVFVIPFNIYNDNNRLNLIQQTKNIIDNPFSYYFNFLTVKATFANLYHVLTNSYLRTEKPTMSKELFWKYQLSEKVTGNYYRTYKYPQKLLAEMKKIKQTGNERGIKILIVIPPTHVDLQNKVYDYGLRDYYNKYKKDLSLIGLYLDYDTKNSMTSDKNNFKDPYHFNDKIAHLISRDICHKLSE